MADPIDSLEIQIKSSSTEAVSHINELIASLKRLKTEASSGFKNPIQQIASGGVGGRRSAGTKQQAQPAKPTVSETTTFESQQIEDTDAKAKKAKDSVRALAEETDKATSKVNLLKSALSGAVSAGKSVGKISLKGITAGLPTAGKYITDKFTSPFKNAIKTVTTWKNAIGRIAFYRAVRSAIKAVTDGFKTGIENLYQYSKIVGTEFAGAMDSLATSSQYLKNSLGAMAAPLIQAIAPAVDILIDKFVALLNAIGKTFAALTGKSTYSQAIKLPKAYAEETENASKALKSFVMGFDELNIIDDSSSSAGKAAEDFGSMFEEVEVPTEMTDWAAKIRAAIENGDWGGAGSLLADKLNEVIDKIDAGSLGRKISTWVNNGLDAYNGFMDKFFFENVGTKVADFLNNIFGGEGIDPKKLGTALAQGINAGIDLAYGFVSTFKFPQFGEWFAGVINSWFFEINWDKFSDVVIVGINGILDGVESFVGKLQAEKMGSQVADFFNKIFGENGVDPKKLGSNIWGLINTALDFAFGFLQKFDFSQFSEWVGTAINSIITGAGNWLNFYDWGYIGSYFSGGFNSAMREINWHNIGGVVSDTLRAVARDVTNFLAELDWFKIGKSIMEFILAIDWLGLLTDVLVAVVDSLGIAVRGILGLTVGIFTGLALDIVAGFKDGILEGFINIGQWIWDHFVDPIIRAVKGFFGIHSPSTVFAEIGEYIVQGLINGVSSMINSVVQTFSELWSKIKGVFSHVGDWFKEKFSAAWKAVKDVFSSGGKIFDGIKEGILNGLKSVVNALIKGINKVISIPFNGINSALQKIKNISILGAKPFNWMPTISVPQIPLLEGGGMVNKGQMFIAREAGPELVGNIGNRTAVANNDQIVTGIQQGVADANREQNALLREQNELLTKILAKTGFSLDGKTIKASVDKATRQAGAPIMAGGVMV